MSSKKIVGFPKHIFYVAVVCLILLKLQLLATAQTPAEASENREALPSPVSPTFSLPEPLAPEPLPPATPLQAPSAEISDATNLLVCPPLATSQEPTFMVTEIEILGSTVLAEEIEFQVSCYLNQPITLTDLLTLRSRITRLYIDAGYITSGAFLPNNQDLSKEFVQIQVVEGKVEDIQINGLRRLSQRYVSDRITQAANPPLNQQRLEDGLQLLQLDPLLVQVNAELAVGSASGLSLLILDVQEANGFNLAIGADNYRAPSIGSTEGTVSASYTNLLGIGDRLTGSVSLSEGLELYDLGYEIPINSLDGTMQARFNNSDSSIVEKPFDNIGIRSDTTSVSVGVRQPLWRSPREEFALGLDFDWRRSRSFILDDVPFSFSAGSENGQAQVSALRFYQDWVKRDSKRVLAAKSQFGLGLDLFNATTNNSGTDGRFISWQGQFQWVEQVSPRLLVITKVNGQLTPDSLLSIERFGIGGVSTVRGYRQNQLVTDNALTASLEVRIPLTQDPGTLQLTPFIEGGGGWNNSTANPDPSFLLGTGLGLRWQPSPTWFMKIDYGIPLVSGRLSRDSLQESGVYFLLNYQPLSF